MSEEADSRLVALKRKETRIARQMSVIRQERDDIAALLCLQKRIGVQYLNPTRFFDAVQALDAEHAGRNSQPISARMRCLAGKFVFVDAASREAVDRVFWDALYSTPKVTLAVEGLGPRLLFRVHRIELRGEFAYYQLSFGKRRMYTSTMQPLPTGWVDGEDGEHVFARHVAQALSLCWWYALGHTLYRLASEALIVEEITGFHLDRWDAETRQVMMDALLERGEQSALVGAGEDWGPLPILAQQ